MNPAMKKEKKIKINNVFTDTDRVCISVLPEFRAVMIADRFINIIIIISINII